MKFANPTQVQIGMSGTFVGIRYRVAGRVVMGMEEGGETRYWQEFNLVGDNGQSATLVYESTDNGPEWKLFILFDPQSPISVAEARAKKVGDTVNLDGTPMKVTLVDDSRAHFIEGVAPEGVELGDIAYYFNAEIPKKMVVASWAGDEIEFYRGMNLPRGMVPKAFGLLKDVPETRWREESDSPRIPWAKIWGAAFVAVIAFFVIRPSCQSNRSAAVLVKPPLAEAPFQVGREGKLDGRSYRITGHAVVEIAQTGRLQDRHEYTLADGDGGTALLIYGFTYGKKDWMLLAPFEPVQPITPVRAAALRAGDSFLADGTAYEVTGLFRATVVRENADARSGLTNGMVLYGFNAGKQTERIMARWTEGSIAFYRGKAVDEKKVKAAFK